MHWPQELEERTCEAGEQRAYWASMAEAKDASVEGLQQMLEAQSAAHRQAQVGSTWAAEAMRVWHVRTRVSVCA